jgi:hypothetical protein
MGKPTFDLCYSEEFDLRAQRRINVIVFLDEERRALFLSVAQRRQERLRRRAHARGAPLAAQKHNVFGLTEIMRRYL